MEFMSFQTTQSIEVNSSKISCGAMELSSFPMVINFKANLFEMSEKEKASTFLDNPTLMVFCTSRESTTTTISKVLARWFMSMALLRECGKTAAMTTNLLYDFANNLLCKPD